MNIATPNIDAGRLREVLSYDAQTGLFTWIAPPWNHPRLLGTPAGAKASGYVMIRIDGRRYKAHRLAWLYVHGAWPTECIDHRDGDPFNNALINLRQATHSQNMGNMARRKGKGLPKGVRQNGKNYTARIKCENRMITLGTFSEIEAAADAYCSAAKRVFGEFSRAV